MSGVSSNEPGALILKGRKILLEYLLYIQIKMDTKLIDEDEIQAILDTWYGLEGIQIARHELTPQKPIIESELIFNVNTKLTKTTQPVFFVRTDITKGESDLFRFIKERVRATNEYFHFFPTYFEYERLQLVWNQVTFVVCQEGITNWEQARDHIFTFLNWSAALSNDTGLDYTEDEQMDAIFYTLLTCFKKFGEVVKKEKLYYVRPMKEIPMESSSDGQLRLII